MGKNFWHKVFSVLINKYVLSLLAFAVWIIFFDQNNLIDRYRSKQKLNQLKMDTLFYNENIKSDREAIHLLKTDPKNLERFAREKYMMKAPDEEIFIILKKDQAK
jgi:cell division protein DivIC